MGLVRFACDLRNGRRSPLYAPPKAPLIKARFGGDSKDALHCRTIATHGLLEAAGDLPKRAMLDCSYQLLKDVPAVADD
jgi:hypothetical protein